MKKQRFYYIINLQYLGFRFSGWQKQPHQKTIEGMVSKTLKFIMPEASFKILGAGRTDAKVSALDAAFELFIVDVPILDFTAFLELFNKNLPSDIRAINIKAIDESYNIIKDPKSKEYVYLFSFGEKNHPFSAPFIANVLEDLDLEAMKAAAKVFVGSHNFSSFTVKGQKNTRRARTIEVCEIKTNDILKANFFPVKSYALYVKGKGFMRYQIRMMMGALIQLGKGEITSNDIKTALKSENKLQITYVAPGSGLFLNKLELD
ncbi:MAG: tRNA pseudouridine(38-40) synthase TruA [Maribacter sp.]|nr:tRNA pseudouridine(38-40) synthase TruA [Maribacter sp.]